MHIWSRPLAALALIAAAALAAWPVLGLVPALLIAIALLIATLVAHLRQLAELTSWLREPAERPVPYGSGAWEQAFSYLARLVRWQKRSEAGLRLALQRFTRAAEAMNEGIVLVDDVGRIEWCNPAAHAHFGLDPEQDIGRQLTYIVRQPQFVAYVLSQHYADPFVLRGWRSDDTALSVHLIPYGDNQKLVISRDVTRWDRLDRMRRDFIANVSHELRTPITVIAGFLETLVEHGQADPDMTRRSLVLMQEQARRMQRLVEDLLTLSRLESSRTPGSEEAVDVPQLAGDLRRDALALSSGRHAVELDLRSDRWLTGSEDELRSAFGNLVSNAVRYTPAGGRIRISWAVEGDEARFAVTDTGIGVAAEHIPRLTERFYRVDRSRSRETGGTGLGLAIVKHALQHHQARLDVESTPGVGSTFTAVFPARRLTAPVDPIHAPVDEAEKTG